VLDSDEIWSQEALEKILAVLDHYYSASFRANSFYGSFDRIMTGFEAEYDTHRIQRWYPGARWETHRPPTINGPDGRPWRNHRHLDGETIGVKFHHYSYVFPTQMKAKAAYYWDRNPSGEIPDYFNRVYLPWVKAHHMDSYDKREAVEHEFQGVHDWTPARRGPTFTKLFDGQHPAEIWKSRKALKERLYGELADAFWGPV